MPNNENAAKGLPKSWYLALSILIVVGLLLLWVDGPDLPRLAVIQPHDCHINWSCLLGVYVTAIPLSHLVIAFALFRTTKLFELKGSNLRQRLWPPALIGILEAVMYPTALLIGKPEFIGLWLALKVAGQWGWWTVEDSNEENVHRGRRRYYQSLIGNALSVLCGATTYLGILLLATKPSV